MELEHSFGGCRFVSLEDIAWLIEQAEVAFELNPFCTTSADHDRLKEIKGVIWQ